MWRSFSNSIHQGILEKHIYQAFPGEAISNARKRASFKNPITGWFFEVDVWIPRLHLGFEFQDPYHYSTTWYSHKTLACIKSKDDLKHESMRVNGATLIPIPCWWDATPESLFSLLQFSRPDLSIPFKSKLPAPLNPPPNYFEEMESQVEVELMHPSFLSATKFYEQSSEGSQVWWLGEKYDGIRCFWHSEKRTLFSRRGTNIYLPPAMDHLLPHSLLLDGELWSGRNMHSDVAKIFGPIEGIVWSFLRLVAFDLIEPQRSPYELRFDFLLLNIQLHDQFIIPSPRMILGSKSHLEESLHQIICDRGEGVILQQVASPYTPGRSSSLLKIKSTRDDAEGIVLRKNEDNSLVLQLPSGMIIDVSSENIAESVLPTKGNIVTYDFEHLTKGGIPVNPRVLRIRTDLFWDDVLSDYARSAHNSELHPTRNVQIHEVEREHKWRDLFQKIARERRLDPLFPSTWYSIPRGEVEKVQGTANVLRYYGGYSATLKSLFPELPPLDERRFMHLKKGYWADVGNRKQFFANFAAENQFDPLIPSNWYSNVRQLTQATKALQLLDYYEGSFVEALLHLYPQIGLDRSAFFGTKSVRKFFDEFARENGFDPLVAQNWYQVSTSDIRKKETWSAALRAYSGNVVKALLYVYPDIGLEEAWFAHLPKNYWSNLDNRRNFFVTFAESKGFNPLIPDPWYSISYEMVYAHKGGPSVLTYYNGNVKSALLHLFPDVAFDHFKFATSRNFWEDSKNKREFFDKFARDRGFDPLLPANWYSLSLQEILATEKARRLLNQYKNDLSRALMDIYPDIGFSGDKFLHVKLKKVKSTQ
eukprot:Phypoly_transcript_02143.p1 GENE.Phypoly_transcript_02143~~Phypoly_transcript_02143.p1  ORF type:complete len:817 (+),score=78.77 Phypoly_transcript_02143:221-2671(+)